MWGENQLVGHISVWFFCVDGFWLGGWLLGKYLVAVSVEMS